MLSLSTISTEIKYMQREQFNWIFTAIKYIDTILDFSSLLASQIPSNKQNNVVSGVNRTYGQIPSSSQINSLRIRGWFVSHMAYDNAHNVVHPRLNANPTISNPIPFFLAVLVFVPPCNVLSSFPTNLLQPRSDQLFSLGNECKKQKFVATSRNKIQKSAHADLLKPEMF